MTEISLEGKPFCPFMGKVACEPRCALYIDISGKHLFGNCSLHHLAVMLLDPSMVRKVLKLDKKDAG